MKSKKFLSLLLALALAVGSLPAALAADSDGDLERMETLMGNIAASYVERSDEWAVMDMAAYAALGLSDSVTSDAARQSYIDYAIASLSGEGAGDTVYAKAILGLTAVGVDAAQLYPAGSEDPISAVDGLNAAEHSASAWCAPYTLAAYQQGQWATEEYESALVDAVLQAQGEDGSWSEWGESVQTTSNMIVGLSFYQQSDPEAAAAVEKALAYLSAAQLEDGGFDAYGSGADSNTAAMVVLALAAAGVDPDADARFVKNGVSALDALLSFAYDDQSGFGYQSGEKGEAESSTAYATEQGFRALIAAWKVMTTGEASAVFEFGANAVVPGYESEADLPGRHEDVQQSVISDPDAGFPDMEGHSAQAAAVALAQRGILNGKDGGVYDPDAGMTRAEFAAAVVRALGLEPKAAEGFSDVAQSDWFAPYVGTANTYGIVTGKSEGVFDPQGIITRQEAAVMVARAAALCGMDTQMDDTTATNVLAQFGDYTAIASWAKEAAAFCYSTDILDQSDLDVRPAEAILRGEIAQMLYNLLAAAELL